MKKIVSLMVGLLLIFTLSACNTSKETVETKTDLEIARENVVNKWKTSSGELGTGKYIEDIYKQYPDDETISAIYFYSTAKGQYDFYQKLEDEEYLESAKDYAENIDPNYDGELADEIHAFTNELLGQTTEEREISHSQAEQKTNNYNTLTNSEKKAICDYIQSRYDYYDSISGGNSGDKYSDKIWEEAASKYGLTESQISIIWMNMYEY